MAGSCELSCEAGLTECSGSCRDLATDRGHCGACGNACAAGEVCTTGSCAASCETGLTECSGSCRDTSIDPANCGGCAVVCPDRANAAPVCVGGGCSFVCDAGFVDCDGDPSNGCEAELAVDEANCGICGNACATGVSCTAGSCGVACFAGDAQVLVYGPGGSTGTAWFPAGTDVTVADDATWRSMTTAEFEQYDVIWIDGGRCTGDVAALMGTAEDTLGTWGPAVNGRIEILVGDPDLHGDAGAPLFYENSVNWLKENGRTADGGGTSLFMSWGCSICCGRYTADARGTPERFASVLGSPISGETDNHCSNVTITSAGATHPVLDGVSLWGCPFHGAFATLPSEYTALVTGNSTGSPTLAVREAPMACVP